MKIKKATAKVMLYHYRPLANGQYPIRLRITFCERSHYIGLGISSSKENWNDETARLIRDPRKQNVIIAQKELLASNVLLDLERENLDFTFSRFEQRFITSKAPTDVLDFLDKRIEELKLVDRLGTANSYKDLKYRLEDYVSPGIEIRRAKYALELRDEKNPKPYSRPALTFHDVDTNFIEGLESFLLARGNAKSSIGIYLRSLRAILNRAQKKELVKESMNPFTRGYQISSSPIRKLKSLRHDEVMAYRDFSCTKKIREDLDLFVLSYFMDGTNLVDIAQLKWNENVRDGRIVYNRSKTDKLIDIEINSSIREILERQDKNSQFIFNIITTGLTKTQQRNRIYGRLKRINKTLKKIAPLIGVDPDITFYWARHSFASRLYSLNVPIQTISEMLSHSDLRTTRIYTGRLDKSHLDSTRKLLQ